MPSQPVIWGDRCIATVVTPKDRPPYMVEPIVFDTNGELVMGAEVLAAAGQAGRTVIPHGIGATREQRKALMAGKAIVHPVLQGYTPAMLAELRGHLRRVGAQLDVGL